MTIYLLPTLRIGVCLTRDLFPSWPRCRVVCSEERWVSPVPKCHPAKPRDFWGAGGTRRSADSQVYPVLHLTRCAQRGLRKPGERHPDAYPEIPPSYSEKEMVHLKLHCVEKPGTKGPSRPDRQLQPSRLPRGRSGTACAHCLSSVFRGASGRG